MAEKLDDCAVLYRSNSQSRVIEEALIRCQIPIPYLWRYAFLRTSRN